jgi:hypothetical protein
LSALRHSVARSSIWAHWSRPPPPLAKSTSSREHIPRQSERPTADLRPRGACGPWRGGVPGRCGHRRSTCGDESHGGACARFCWAGRCVSRRILHRVETAEGNGVVGHCRGCFLGGFKRCGRRTCKGSSRAAADPRGPYRAVAQGRQRLPDTPPGLSLEKAGCEFEKGFPKG